MTAFRTTFNFVGAFLLSATAFLSPHMALAQEKTDTIPGGEIRLTDATIEAYKLKDSMTQNERKISLAVLEQAALATNSTILSKSPRKDNVFRAGATSEERFEKGLVEVNVKAVVSDELVKWMETNGCLILSRSDRFNAIHAKVPVDFLKDLSMRHDVSAIRDVKPPKYNKTNTSEGVAGHKAQSARLTYGISGTGIRVGVMSDSEKYLSDMKASGDLPSNVTILRSGIGSSHDTGEGTAMMEIVHDVAPGANLFFSSANATEEEAAERFIAMFEAGCRVLCDDVGFGSELAFSDGPFTEAIDEITSRGGICLSSAGNAGNIDVPVPGYSELLMENVWEGDWKSSGTITTINGKEYELHEFPDGSTFTMLSCFPSPTECPISLEWSDPPDSSNNDYDLGIMWIDPNWNGTLEVPFPESQTGAGCKPIESLTINNINDFFNGAAWPALVILKKKDAKARHLRLWVDSPFVYIDNFTSGHIVGHSACEKVISVAGSAAPGSQAFSSLDKAVYYSSDGPRRVFHKWDGTPFTSGNLLASGGIIRNKPDITAATEVSCATPGFNPFAGTSASAPHAAGIAALMLEANPGLTRDEVFSIMRQSSLAGSNPPWSRTMGYGIINAEECVKGARASIVSLATALDNTSLPFTTGGDASWIGQKAVSHDGTDAARSGAIIHGQSTWLQTKVSGAGTISFWWKASCESGSDKISFSIDGSDKATTDGVNGGWTSQSFAITGAGEHTLKWAYGKNGTISRGWDCAWVDQITWTPSSVVPAPSNDNFASPIEISGISGSKTGSNVGATLESAEAMPSARSLATKSVWYKWTAQTTGIVTVDTIGSEFDTILGIYTGESVSALTEKASNDDIERGVLDSRVTFTADAGTTYRIAVYGYNGTSGSFNLNWKQTPSDNKPNLVPYKPSAFPAAIYLSREVNGGAVSTAISKGDTLYLNFAYANFGKEACTSHRVAAVVKDDEDCVVKEWNLKQWRLNVNDCRGVTDLEFSVPETGTYTVQVTLDSANVVDEGDESDNTFQLTFTATASPSTQKPNLVPYKPKAWPAAIYLAREMNSQNVVTAVNVGETVYLNFAYANFGAEAAASHRVSAVVKDGVGNMVSDWNLKQGRLNVNDCRGVTDLGFSVATAGTYTVLVTLDFVNVLDESNESDNICQLTFTATSPVSTQTVTFDANGGHFGSWAEDTIGFASYSIGAVYSAMPVPTRGGDNQIDYEFLGWYSADTGGSLVSNGSPVTSDTARTLYAHWRAVRIWVNFDEDSMYRAADIGATYAYPIGDVGKPSRGGYKFLGWFSSRSGGTQITADTKVTISSPRTLYSHWARASYNVAFNANGGRGKMAAQKMTYGKAVKLRKNVFTRTGWIFAGWAVKKGGAIAYANGQSVKNLTAKGGTVTLYAVWAKKTYTVAFQANGGKGTMAVESFTYGKAKKLSANKFKAPKGKKFAGWATSKANAKKGVVKYKNKQSVKNLVTTGKTVKLYAVWRKK